MVFSEDNEDSQDEFELLTLLIDDWDERHRLTPELDSVELLQSLMANYGLNQNELAEIAGMDKIYISEILNYRKECKKSDSEYCQSLQNSAGGFEPILPN